MKYLLFRNSGYAVANVKHSLLIQSRNHTNGVDGMMMGLTGINEVSWNVNVACMSRDLNREVR